MAITASQNRPDYDMVFGPQPIVLSGLTSELKYALRITGPTGTPIYSDIRQSANENGSAVFDIQNILQSYVSTPNADITSLGLGTRDILQLASNEIFSYGYSFGYDNGGGFVGVGSSTQKDVIGGTKPYYVEDFNFNSGDYRIQPTVVGDDSITPCTDVVGYGGNPLTSWRESTQAQNLQGGVPSGVTGGRPVFEYDMYVDDLMSVSWFNNVNLGNNAPAFANHIGGFRYVFYNGTTSVFDFVVPNTTLNGGGPNTSWNGSVPGGGSSLVVSCGVGPQNIRSFSYVDVNGTTQNMVISPNTYTHYYVYPVALTPTSCISTHTGYADEPLSTPLRINKFIDGSCLDYEPIQFAWLNPYGFMDYYSFNKLNRKSLKTTQNTFLKEPANYASTSYAVEPENRGYQTYSQKTQEEWVATSGYMSDSEAEYLQYLFSSPDVRVRLGNNAPTGYELTYWPANVLSLNWTQKSFQRNKLFQYEIRFKLANNIKTQNG